MITELQTIYNKIADLRTGSYIALLEYVCDKKEHINDISKEEKKSIKKLYKNLIIGNHTIEAAALNSLIRQLQH